MKQLPFDETVKSFDPSTENPVHAPFMPLNVRPGDRISAKVTLTSASTQEVLCKDVIVWRLSPFGIEFICDTPDIDVGASLNLELSLNKHRCEFSGMVVSHVAKAHGHRLLGVRWCENPGQAVPLHDRRLSRRWICGNEFLPTGMAPNPMKFDDFIHFRVKDFSRTGMQVLTSMRNKLLVPGMKLESILTFPMMGQAKIDFVIKNARIVSSEGRSDLSLGVHFVDLNPRAVELISQYVLQFGPPTTVEELRDENLPVRSVTQSIDYAFVRSADDYEQVLRLRHECYSAAGKLPPGAKPADTADIFDTHARILVAKYRGKVVGSLRIVFPDGESPLEHEQFFDLPAHFPRQDELVEVSRVCTSPDFRGSDLLMGMFRRCTLTILQSKRRYTLGSSTEKLLPHYKKLGLIPTDIKYAHTGLGGEEHTVFIGDNYGVVVGQNVGPLVWNAMYAELFHYLSRQDIISFGSAVNVRLAMYRLFRPVAYALQDREFEKQRKKD